MDIDHLHKIVNKLDNNEFIFRRQGKTYTLLTLLIGEMELGGVDETYYYITSTHAAVLYTIEQFIMILCNMGFKNDDFTLIKHVTKVRLNSTRNNVIFKSIESLTERDVNGVYVANVYFDLSIEEEVRYAEKITTLKTRIK